MTFNNDYQNITTTFTEPQTIPITTLTDTNQNVSITSVSVVSRVVEILPLPSLYMTTAASTGYGSKWFNTNS